MAAKYPAGSGAAAPGNTENKGERGGSNSQRGLGGDGGESPPPQAEFAGSPLSAPGHNRAQTPQIARGGKGAHGEGGLSGTPWHFNRTVGAGDA